MSFIINKFPLFTVVMLVAKMGRSVVVVPPTQLSRQWSLRHERK